MATKLADELLQMILSPSLTIPHEQLISPSPTMFGSNDSVPSASALLVCKRWLRVATPLLYDTVVIRSTGQAYALADALKSSPAFSEFVKKIRLEGAYAALGQILTSCSKLSTLVILLRIYSDANVTGLCRALPLIDPTTIIFHDEWQIDNAKLRKTLISLFDAIPKWKNLTTFEFPYRNHGQGNAQIEPNVTRRSRLIDALAKSKSLRVVSCDLPAMPICHWEPLTRIPTITIRFRYNSARSPYLICSKNRVLDEILRDTRISQSSFEFVDIADTVSVDSMKDEDDTPAPSFSFPSVSSVTPEIWIRIFASATIPSSPDAFHPLKPWDSPGSYNTTRKNLALVCKSFARLVIPLFFTAPLILSSSSLHTFTEKVLQAPHLGPRVIAFTLSGTSGIRGDRGIFVDDLCSLIPHLTSLRHFILLRKFSWGTATITPKAFTSLAEAAGHSLLSITLDFPQDTINSLLPTVLSSFKKLVKIDIESPPRIAKDRSGLQFDSLSTLRELRLPGSCSFLDTLSELRLPQLRSVVFTGATPPTVENFMKACGSQVRHLEFLGTADFADLFPHVPNLLTLRWEPHGPPWNKYSEMISSALNHSASHEKLQRFSIKRVPDPRSGEKEQSHTIRTFFDYIQVANFPSLKEIQFQSYIWPVEERSILKDVLPSVAVQIKQKYDVDVTDSSGKPWRPRVQKRR